MGLCGGVAAQVVEPDAACRIAPGASEQAWLERKQGRVPFSPITGIGMGAKPGAYWPVSPCSPVGRSTASSGAVLLRNCSSKAGEAPLGARDGVAGCQADAQQGIDAQVMRAKTGRCFLGELHARLLGTLPGAQGVCRCALGAPSQVTTTGRPLLVQVHCGFQAVATVVARAAGNPDGARAAPARASRATASPARCISVCAGRWAAPASSMRRVAAVSWSRCGWSGRIRCMAAGDCAPGRGDGPLCAREQRSETLCAQSFEVDVRAFPAI